MPNVKIEFVEWRFGGGIMFCMECGTKLPDNAKFCINCGSKISVNQSMDEKEKKESDIPKEEKTNGKVVSFNIGKEEIIFDEEQVAFFEIEGLFRENAFKMRKMFQEYYEANIHDINGIFSLGIPYIHNRFEDSLKFGYQVLQSYGISSVSVDQIREMTQERVSSIDDRLEDFYESVDDIMRYAKDLQRHREATQGNRSYWQGGGFGVKGAIKGAITAGVLNMGTDVIRGMTDGIKNKIDRDKVMERQNRLFNQSSTFEQLCDAVEMSCFHVRNAVGDILIENEKIAFINSNWDYYYEKIKKESRKYEKQEISWDELLVFIAQGLQDDPTNRWYYSALYLYAPNREFRIAGKTIADYFRMAGDYLELADKYDTGELVKILKNEELTIPDIKKKMEDLYILKEKALADIDVSEYEKELNDKLIKKQEEQNLINERNAEETDSLLQISKEEEIQRIRKHKAKVDDLITSENMSELWKLIGNGDAYAEYAVLNKYKKLCEPDKKLFDQNAMDEKLLPLNKYKNEKTENAVEYIVADIHYGLYASYEGKYFENKRSVISVMVKLAEQGEIGAMATVGFWGMHGYNDIQIDVAKKYLIAAAEKKQPMAMAWLGSYYKNGHKNIEQNRDKALLLLTYAAEYGQPYGIKELNNFNNSSSCYITTAVCNAFGKPDDCYELTVFRKFRDKWLRKQPDGEMLIREYYKTAPHIVDVINNRSSKEVEYRYIWNQYLKPCLGFIENEKFENCKTLYCKMVYTLNDEYNKIAKRGMER